MKLIKPLLLAAPALVLASCQTQPLPEPLDVTELQRAAVKAAFVEFCRGQEPLQAVHPAEDGQEPEPVTLDELLSSPPWVQGYIQGNFDQWETPCKEALQP